MAKTVLPNRTGSTSVVGGLSQKKLADLVAIGADSALAYQTNLQRIYDETDRYLASLARQVHEGKAVDEAANFGRWLQFSGVLVLLERFNVPGKEFPSLQSRITD
jgi:hypothetical protein